MNFSLNHAHANANFIGHPDSNRFLTFDFFSSAPSMDVDPNPVFCLNRSGRVLVCNTSFEKLLQRRRSDLIDRSLNEIFPKAMSSQIHQELIEFKLNRVVKNSLIKNELSEEMDQFFLMTFTRTLTSNTDSIIVVSFTKISDLLDLISKINPGYWNQEEFDQQIVGSEVLMRAAMIQNRLLEWMNKLQMHLTAEGRRVLLTVKRNFKREIDEDIKLRAELKFDQQNNELYKRIAFLSPRVTKYEMRLCSLFVQGNTSADIARITCRSANSINVAFARIRTKLRVPNNHHLKSLLTAPAG